MTARGPTHGAAGIFHVFWFSTRMHTGFPYRMGDGPFGKGNMASHLFKSSLIMFAALVCTTHVSRADFVMYGNYFGGNGSSWFDAVPNHDTITFTEYPQYTPITDQYADLGATFTDTDENWIMLSGNFHQDGSGLHGNQVVEMVFDTPMWAFAVHFVGTLYFHFYMGEELLFSEGVSASFESAPHVGFTTDTPFDRVLILPPPPNPFGVYYTVLLDNVYFTAVPAPAGFVLMALAGWRGSRRRR